MLARPMAFALLHFIERASPPVSVCVDRNENIFTFRASCRRHSTVAASIAYCKHRVACALAEMALFTEGFGFPHRERTLMSHLLLFLMENQKVHDEQKISPNIGEIFEIALKIGWPIAEDEALNSKIT
jgi:hypothetical protein